MTRRVHVKDDTEGQEKQRNKGMNLDHLNPLTTVNQVKMSHVNESFPFGPPLELPPENQNFSTNPTSDAVLIKRSTSKLQYLCKNNEVHCPHFNETTGTTSHHCCSGYCIDLLLRLADALNFTFNLYQVIFSLYFIKNFQFKIYRVMLFRSLI